MTTDPHHALALPEPRPATAAELAAVGEVNPVALAAALGLCRHTDPLLIAARTGLAIARLRAEHREALAESSKAISVAYRRAGLARRPSLAEIERHRWAPTGRREDWITHQQGGAA